MVSCSFADCDVTKCNNPKKYTFHRFPSDPVVREKWQHIVNRENWTPKKFSVVCSKHFEEKYFIQQKHRTVLREDSLPTLSVPVQLKERREAPLNINRVPKPMPIPNLSQKVLSPQKILTKCAELRKIIVEKNNVIRNIKKRTKRMSKKVLYLETIVNELNNTTPGQITSQGSDP